jgi:hypothetical protein
MKSPFTNRGSNQDADSFRDQAVDREREASETKRAEAMVKPILDMIDKILMPVKKAKQK